MLSRFLELFAKSLADALLLKYCAVNKALFSAKCRGKSGVLSSDGQHLEVRSIQREDGEAWQAPVPFPQDNAAPEDAQVLNDDAWSVWQDGLPMPALCCDWKRQQGT